MWSTEESSRIRGDYLDVPKAASYIYSHLITGEMNNPAADIQMRWGHLVLDERAWKIKTARRVMYSGRNEHPQTVYEFICGQLLDVGDGFIS
jgi:hypothetical protein